jgi:hypothetical protein
MAMRMVTSTPRAYHRHDANDLSYECGISGGEGWGVIHGDGLTLASAVDD